MLTYRLVFIAARARKVQADNLDTDQGKPLIAISVETAGDLKRLAQQSIIGERIVDFLFEDIEVLIRGERGERKDITSHHNVL